MYKTILYDSTGLATEWDIIVGYYSCNYTLHGYAHTNKHFYESS